MRFRTGFVVGCAAGFYLTRKARQLRAPIPSRGQLAAPASEWPAHSGPMRVLLSLRPRRYSHWETWPGKERATCYMAQSGTLPANA